MIIRVGAEGASLGDADDLKSFKVVAPRAASFALGDAGRRDGDVVWVSEAWLRASTAEMPQAWRDGFEKMVAFARSKGWYTEAQDGQPAAIRAHIEWAEG
jgi:hypothetical protein